MSQIDNNTQTRSTTDNNFHAQKQLVAATDVTMKDGKPIKREQNSQIALRANVSGLTKSMLSGNLTTAAKFPVAVGPANDFRRIASFACCAVEGIDERTSRTFIILKTRKLPQIRCFLFKNARF